MCGFLPYANATPVTKPPLAISARSLKLTLGSDAAPVEILRGIDLDVASGEVMALLGASGSGKSSLMAVLSGLERASSGALLVAGADFTSMDEDALAKARRGRIGIVLQAFHLLPTMTAAENVATPMELSGVADARERAEAELRAVGLGHRLDHYPTQLSGGEQQRVAIARAIAKQPEVLLCDEPTGALDSKTGVRVLEALDTVNKELGTTTAIITHNAGIRAIAHRVFTFGDGRIVEVVVNETRIEPSQVTW